MPGYNGVYEVSSRGRFRSLDRVVETQTGPRKYVGRSLKPARVLDTGYLNLKLSVQGVKSTRLAHSLVLEAFVGLRPEGMETRHADDIGHHNCLANLSWGTHLDNIYDMIRNGRHALVNRNAAVHSCPQGHPLVAANLKPKDAERGVRACLSCDRARALITSRTRYGSEVPDFQQLADSYFEDIMSEQVAS